MKLGFKHTTIDPEFLNNLENDFVPTEEDINAKYQSYKITHLQQYNPIYSLFFDINKDNFNSFSLNHLYNVKSMTKVVDENNQIIKKEVYIKYSPLYDPIHYMIGKYETTEKTIPILPSFNIKTHTKIDKINNASYVDCFFYFLSNQLLQNNFIHGIEFYGSYLGIQEKFKMNVTEDFSYLYESTYFHKNLENGTPNSLFCISKNIKNYFENIQNKTKNSGKNKINLNICHNHSLKFEDIENIEINKDIKDEKLYEECAVSEATTTVDGANAPICDEGAFEIIYDKNGEDDTSSTDSERNDSSSEDEDEEDEEEEEEDEENEEEEEENEPEEIYAYINNFPIQLICLEKCNGTITELFEDGSMNDKTSASALFQIIMILLFYQKIFDFTHNDLHTNNIMYIHTDKQYLYYKVNSSFYKVPTYGKIFKLIDFGRSIYKFGGHQFCSDSFDIDGDASTQYNFEPFFDETKKRIEPNYSFDICRLGTSIYDYIFDEPFDSSIHKMNELTELQKTVLRWCLDDSNKNVLYKKNGEDRYPEFKLYKMIARTVHSHTPMEQLKFKFFKQFKVKNVPVKIKIMDLDLFEFSPCSAI